MLQPTYGLGLSWDTDQPQAEMQRKSRRGPAGLASECSVKSAGRQEGSSRELCAGAPGRPAASAAVTQRASRSDAVTQDGVTASDNARALPTHHVLSRLFGSDFVFSHSGRTDGVMVPASAEGPRHCHCHCHCPHCCLAWPSTTQPRTLASPRLTTSFASVSYPFCCYLFSSTSCSVWVLVLFPVSFSCHFSN